MELKKINCDEQTSFVFLSFRILVLAPPLFIVKPVYGQKWNGVKFVIERGAWQRRCCSQRVDGKTGQDDGTQGLMRQKTNREITSGRLGQSAERAEISQWVIKSENN